MPPAKKKKNIPVGHAAIDLKGPVTAASYVTCRLTFTAGFYGVDDSGSIKICSMYPCDAGTPQFDDPKAPNYTTAVASNGAELVMAYDLKRNRRPWDKTLHIQVTKGFLAEGDRIVVTFGDRSQGSPGWRMQTFREKNFRLKTLVDHFATYQFEEVPESPSFEIVPGKAVRMVAVAPSVVRPGEAFTIRARFEDIWGNALKKTITRRHKGFKDPGVHRLPVGDKRSGLSCVTNPVLVSVDATPVHWADFHGQSEETIGINDLDHYFHAARDKAFLDVCSHQGNDFQVTDSLFKRIEKYSRDMSKDGEFLVFPGYEWSGNTHLGGDHNVIFKNTGLVTRSCQALIDPKEASEPDSPTMDALFKRLRDSDRETVVFAHVGGRYADMDYHDPELQTAVEIHSAWGTFEWLLADALERGLRVGVVANSDDHKGRLGMSHPGASRFGSYGGLTALEAPELTRDAIWEAMTERRHYATTGARMILDVSTDTGLRPGAIAKAEKAPTFRLRVHATAPIDNIQLRRGMKAVKTWRPDAEAGATRRVRVVWSGAEVRGRGRNTLWVGAIAARCNRIVDFEPINVFNVERPMVLKNHRRLEFDTVTTGGQTGAILTLDKAGRGTLSFESNVRNTSIDLRDVTRKPRVWKAGKLDRQVAIVSLPDPNPCLDEEVSFRPGRLEKGDNAFYFRVEQEDGHIAWSSPIYLTR